MKKSVKMPSVKKYLKVSGLGKMESPMECNQEDCIFICRDRICEDLQKELTKTKEELPCHRCSGTGKLPNVGKEHPIWRAEWEQITKVAKDLQATNKRYREGLKSIIENGCDCGCPSIASTALKEEDGK